MKLAVLTLALLIGGAGYAETQKSYLNPSYGDIKVSDIARPAQPYKLKLKVEFQRNGQHRPPVDALLRNQVSAALQSAGFATVAPDSDSVSDEVFLTVNNVADLDEARRKGFGTGLTFGLKGSTATDNYEMQATVTIAGKTVTKSGYKVAIETIIGHGKPPAGVTGLTLTDAVNAAFEQLVFQLLRDPSVAEFSKNPASVSNTPQPAAPQTNTLQPANSNSPQPATTAATGEAAWITVKSTPDGADILLDGKFVGNTPSTLRVKAGSHSIRVEHSGFRAWEKSLAISADDQITLNAVLNSESAGGKQ